MSYDADDPYLADEPMLCPFHGCDLADDGYCDACWLAHYERTLTWDADDEADDRVDREREREY